jgi:hypothetical protein
MSAEGRTYSVATFVANDWNRRRREGWQTRLANAARRHINPGGDDVDMRDGRRLVYTKNLEIVEVLLDAPVFEADLAERARLKPITAAPSICE